MSIVLSERKRSRIKKSILRDIFADNLRMVGKEDNSRKRRKTAIVTIGSLFLFSLITYFVLSNFAQIEHPFFQYGRLGLIKSGTAEQDISPKLRGTVLKNLNPAQYSAFLNELQIPISNVFGLKVRTIIIDPGHGGEDPGATGKMGTREKDITLDIAKKLRDRLEKNKDYQILMTREEDITLSLEDRIEFANSIKADLYISIHVNYIPSRPINAIETYYFGPHTDRASLKLAEKENMGSQYTLSDFNEIIKKIENTLKTQESILLARSIQNSLYKNIKKQNRSSVNFGTKTAPFIVLLGVDVPSILTEVTCLSNRREEEKLNNEQYREEIAGFLEEGINNYLVKNKVKREVHYAAKRDITQTK